jgi:hypothetical protein
MTRFSKSLNNVLQDLQKSHWSKPLLELSDKFSQLPEEARFDNDILNMLLQLRHDLDQDPSLPLSVIAAIRFSSLDAFTYRFHSPTGFLNPLSDHFPSQLEITQASHAYPPPDILKRWSRENLT